jgi:hypothetical protein
MNTAAFDAEGRCLFVLNDYIEAPEAAAVVHTEESVNPNLVWYDFETSAIKYRGPLPYEVAANTITGLPPGTTAHVGDSCTVVNDGVLELEVEYAQDVRVLLTHVRHLDVEIEVPCEI